MPQEIRQVLINGYPIDCSKVETHNFTSETTDNPIESGSIISDHIANMPIEVTLECVVSDTPIGTIASHSTRTLANAETGDVPIVSQDAYSRLKELRQARLPVAIETSLDRFENMVLTSLSIPRESRTSGGLTFEVTFKQITIVENRRVRVAVPRAQGKTDKVKPAKNTKVKFFRTDLVDGTWFDPDVNAWRYSAVQLPDGKVLYTKGALVGAPPPNIRTDEEWKEYVKEQNQGLVSVGKTKKAINPKSGKSWTAADVQKTKENLSQQGYDLSLYDIPVFPGN